MTKPDRPLVRATLRSAEAMRRLGRAFGRRFLARGGRAALHGPMGSGKTVFARGVAEAFGLRDWTSSPTFSLMNEAPLRRGPVRVLRHLDLYRLSGPDEACASGLDEAIADGEAVCLVEWPERAWTLIPRPFYRVEFTLLSPTVRRVEVFEEP